MERDLHARDRVGVQDFVLLENFQSEEAFVDNLRKRFKEDLIYVSRCSSSLGFLE
jgi:myosin-1